MPATKNNALNKAKKLVSLLNLNSIEVAEAYLFGSSISGINTENSDIDVAIISKDFAGIPFYDVKKISKYRRSIDLKLEVHPFSIEDAIEYPSAFLDEIKSKGIKIM